MDAAASVRARAHARTHARQEEQFRALQKGPTSSDWRNALFNWSKLPVQGVGKLARQKRRQLQQCWTSHGSAGGRSGARDVRILLHPILHIHIGAWTIWVPTWQKSLSVGVNVRKPCKLQVVQQLVATQSQCPDGEFTVTFLKMCL